jgi:hypothetical protein
MQIKNGGRAVSCERPSACHINIKSTVDQRSVCHTQKGFRNSSAPQLANFSGKAIFPTLFQVLTIRLKNDPWKVDVLQYGDFNI